MITLSYSRIYAYRTISQMFLSGPVHSRYTWLSPLINWVQTRHYGLLTSCTNLMIVISSNVTSVGATITSTHYRLQSSWWGFLPKQVLEFLCPLSIWVANSIVPSNFFVSQPRFSFSLIDFKSVVQYFNRSYPTKIDSPASAFTQRPSLKPKQKLNPLFITTRPFRFRDYMQFSSNTFFERKINTEPNWAVRIFFL